MLPSSTLIEIDVGSNHARGCGFLFQTFSFRLLFIYLTRYSEESVTFLGDWTMIGFIPSASAFLLFEEGQGRSIERTGIVVYL